MLPIERPQKIICIGLNYSDHAEEQGVDLPERPLLFAKWPNTLIGPGEPIVIPSITERVDYEAELGVVIGSRASGVSVENALEAVAGYICANDVSRGISNSRTGSGCAASRSTRSAPSVRRSCRPRMSPIHRRSASAAILNGQVMQESTTANMVFGVAEIVAFVSQAITLEAATSSLRGRPPASESSATHPCCCSPATRSPSRSTVSERSPTP